jgi:hypothetical protein
MLGDLNPVECAMDIIITCLMANHRIPGFDVWLVCSVPQLKIRSRFRQKIFAKNLKKVAINLLL